MRPSADDPSMNASLNPVTLPDGRVVAWGEAFVCLSNEGMAAARPSHEEKEDE